MKPLTVEDLSHWIHKTPNTIRYDMCRHPERLPRWFKCPGSREPLWLVATVEKFLEAQAAEHQALPEHVKPVGVRP